MYTVVRVGGKYQGVTRQVDSAFIPADPRNSDYTAFLAWNSAQQTPLNLDDTFDLVDYKRQKYSSIEAKTQSLLDAGFEYPASSGYWYSLSKESQTTWLGLVVSKDVLTAQGAYPVAIGAKDNRVGSLANADAVVAFYGTGLARISAILQAGAALAAQVQAATTKAGVDAVVDNRT